jgi:Protein of unknown function (DUF4230)
VKRLRRWVVPGAVLVVVVALAGYGGVGLANRLNLFGIRTVVQGPPPLLLSIKAISRYHAAVGNFQVVVDVEQDVKHVPAVIAGERTLFVAAGTVDAYVDLSGLDGNALSVSPDRRTARLVLPPAQLDEPNLDPARSYVFDQRRGLFNRLASVVSVPDQHEFYGIAEQRILEAAKASSLATQAEDNTKAMLIRLFASLGLQLTFPSP